MTSYNPRAWVVKRTKLNSKKGVMWDTLLGMLDCTSLRRLFERYFICCQIKRTVLIKYFNTRYYADFLLFNYSLVEVLGLAHNAPCTNLRWPMKHLKKLESNISSASHKLDKSSRLVLRTDDGNKTDEFSEKVPNGLWPLARGGRCLLFLNDAMF